MKILFTLVLLCLINLVHAQSSYLRFSTGYGLPYGQQKVGEDYTYESFSNKEIRKSVFGSLGEGLYISAGYGQQIKGPYGWDIEASYMASFESELQIDDQGYQTGTLDYDATGFVITPSITLSATSLKKVSPYARLGPTVGFYTIEYTESFLLMESNHYSYAEKYSGGVSIGLRGTVGFIVNNTKRMQFFTEMNFATQNYSPTKGEITRYSDDWGNQLPTLSSEEKNFKFERTVTQRDSDPANYTRTKVLFPLSSLALMVGVRYSFKSND